MEGVMQESVIISGVRTPIGRYMGILKEVPAYDLAALVLNDAIRRAQIKAESVDDVIMGQSYQSGEYVNIARMALLKAGWPESVPGITVDRRCCTGLDVVCSAVMKIQTNDADIVVAGGVESMSSAEFYLPGEIKWGVGGKKGMPKGHGDLSIWGIPFYDRVQRARVMSQPEERYGILPSMMSWAETASKEHGISREECDKWALASHKKAYAAAKGGKFADEIISVPIMQRNGELFDVEQDEGIRGDTTLEKLTRLKPVLGGVCTAGNSSSENDGAAAVVVTSLKKAKDLGVDPLATLRSWAIVGDDPRRAYKTVPKAVSKALRRAGLTLNQIDLIEVHEAFAAQVLADLKEMGIGPDSFERINVNGSGISLGHPIACTGTRALVTLLYEMRRRNARFGLLCICGGGGIGIAAIIEKI
jgi:acetyl-CoA C-acetyltransferase